MVFVGKVKLGTNFWAFTLENKKGVDVDGVASNSSQNLQPL